MTYFANVKRPVEQSVKQFTPQQVLQRVEEQAINSLRITSPYAAQFAKSVVIDPGAELSPEDSQLWLTLLSKACTIDRDLYARLFYLRGGGVKLVPNQQFGYLIVPIIDPTGKRGWTSQAFYDQEKQCLQPYLQQIIDLFKWLSHASQMTQANLF